MISTPANYWFWSTIISAEERAEEDLLFPLLNAISPDSNLPLQRHLKDVTLANVSIYVRGQFVEQQWG